MLTDRRKKTLFYVPAGAVSSSLHYNDPYSKLSPMCVPAVKEGEIHVINGDMIYTYYPL